MKKKKFKDISAILLTIGEPSTDLARKSIEAQSVTPVKTVTVGPEIITYHASMNYGVGKVETDYFVQVDADMVLDEHCFETLRSNIEEDTFAVSAYLRDPLMGVISGVKIWRTECCRRSPFPDTVSPETDVRTPLIAQGMRLKNLT